MAEEKTSILILGAGKRAVELINSLHKSKKVNIAGIVDIDLNAPGLRLARELNIPISSEYEEFLKKGRIDVIVNLTDSVEVQKGLLDLKCSDVEVIGGRGANLFGDLAESSSSAGGTNYRSVFDNMLSGVAYHKILTDEKNKPVDYIFLEINKAFEKLIGLKKDEVIGKKVTEVLPWITSSIFDWVNFYGEVASSGKEIKFEQYLKNLNRWYTVSAYSQGKGYFITIYNDITERKIAEDSLRKAYDTLKKTQAQLIQTEKMEVVGKLASGVAHEVKNPLATIQQGVDYLSKKLHDCGEDVYFVLNSMRDVIKRASDIINDLLDFSRVSNMQMVPEDFNAVIESALLLIKNDIERYRIDVIRDFDSKIPKVALDKNRIEQVFINLLMNAIQAMADGGQLKIRTYTRRHQKGQEMIIVEIEDTGTGIPGEVLDKIFDPFFTTKEVGKGAGLGLSIVKNIIEGHNGEIKIENRKDRSGARAIMRFKV